ncbi:hypothetical protein JKF63_00864 [Porcisia hertigi]|uniref:HMG box domain-containing protein n=1 Tax=Porcisia hertigi TaxID=2761500 RepID=A0A836HQQ5_9TRYP|nr:hypothetical protein JKF63_00864 [Porcisia hertigi]
MLCRTRVQYRSRRGKVFEIFCREQLLTNRSLCELTQGERRKAISQLFRDLSEERLLGLKQQASIEQLRQEALERAAAFFKPVTLYEFFTQEQQDNPAIVGASPREKEMKLLHIFESLPEKARKALEVRAEQYNVANSKRPTAPVLPMIPARKRPAFPTSNSSTKTEKKKTRKRREKAHGRIAKENTQKETAQASIGEPTTLKKKKAVEQYAAPPYSVFVKEQMASLHHVKPKERMRVIGERWRSLTHEERQRRLEAAKVKLADNLAASTQKEGMTESSTPRAMNKASAKAFPTTVTPLSSAAKGACIHTESASPF